MNGFFYELKGIDTELERLRNRIKELNIRKSNIKEQVVSYMTDNGVTEHTFENKKYNIITFTKHAKKSSKKRQKDILDILESKGIYGNEADEICKSILDSTKGETKTEVKLKESSFKKRVK